VALAAFYVLAFVVLAAALAVVLAQNPINSAVALVVALFGIAALFALAGSGFLAVIQVLIYAGAVLTLFIFVIMLLNLRPEELTETGVTFQKVAGVVVAVLVIVNVAFVSQYTVPYEGAARPADDQMIRLIAHAVFNRYALAFEMTSPLLLAAILGVVSLARREAAR
jgi:NADH-quinone oxidoreductase subunit J